MSYRLEIGTPALADIREAAGWYAERETDLGNRFVREVVAAIDALPTNPLIHRLRHRRLGARWCYPLHFPYRIVFRVKAELITVVAVIHAARHDRAWKTRL